jgi:UDP-2,3-diacylglucosamine pyrophosphatase LpxH
MKNITTILSEIEEFSDTVYYIPGNHDPPQLFADSEDTLTETGISKNVN